eukprot:TRINITY_DN27994_c0_g1_i2.p1 TRINITY_DN27994_c0_g1~~TRINITY_DN27994_c0_g1_i2.p1  ORF type:complete len:154 (-),score=23.46 TRINITY_DN27994_c0_g1_i2:281-742(-)
MQALADATPTPLLRHRYDERIDPPVSWQGDDWAEVLWRLDWLLPKIDELRRKEQHTLEDAAEAATSAPASSAAGYGAASTSSKSRSVPYEKTFVAGGVRSAAPASVQSQPSASSPFAYDTTEWLRVESKSHPGKYYYFNRKTGATSWTDPRKQ